jgi:hypothetical protein
MVSAVGGRARTSAEKSAPGPQLNKVGRHVVENLLTKTGVVAAPLNRGGAGNCADPGH